MPGDAIEEWECKWCGDPSRGLFFCCHDCRMAWRDSPTRGDRYGEPKRLAGRPEKKSDR